MADYPLARARSMALVRSRSVEPTGSLLTRTYSVPDMGQYYNWSYKYKPYWNSISAHTPYRYRRDYDLYDDYWTDRYYYFSPLYRNTLYARNRYSYSDYLPNPYFWSPSSSYWTRYKGYWYDYDYPTYYRRQYSSAYDRYLTTTYTPYRSYLLDSTTGSLARGLSMYRSGTLNNYTYTDPTGKNLTLAYLDKGAREYTTSWNNK